MSTWAGRVRWLSTEAGLTLARGRRERAPSRHDSRTARSETKSGPDRCRARAHRGRCRGTGTSRPPAATGAVTAGLRSSARAATSCDRPARDVGGKASTRRCGARPRGHRIRVGPRALFRPRRRQHAGHRRRARLLADDRVAGTGAQWEPTIPRSSRHAGRGQPAPVVVAPRVLRGQGPRARVVRAATGAHRRHRAWTGGGLSRSVTNGQQQGLQRRAPDVEAKALPQPEVQGAPRTQGSAARDGSFAG